MNDYSSTLIFLNLENYLSTSMIILDLSPLQKYRYPGEEDEPLPPPPPELLTSITNNEVISLNVYYTLTIYTI